MISLSIKQKLFGLGGIVVAAFLVFGGVYIYSASIRADAAAEAARIYHIDHEEAAVKTGILQARRDEKDFLLRMDTKYIDKHRDTMAGVYESLDKLNSHIRSAAHKQTVEDLTRLVKEYDQGFQAMTEMQIKVGLDEKVGLLGALRTSVHNVEGYLKKLGEKKLGGRSQSAFDKMMIKMLMMRRHEKDFLARKKDKYIESQAKRKGEFYEILYSSGLGGHDIEMIRTNMEAYHRDFNALAKGMKEVDAAIAKFRDTIHATDPALERVEGLVKQLENENKAYQATADTRIATLLVTTMILGGVVIIGSIMLLALAITRGLDEAVRACRNVADGKLGLNIQPKSNDEIGQLLSSLKFMDENLTRVVTEVQDAIGNIGGASQQIAAGNTSLSQRTEEQASSLEETASSMEEMTGTVKQNADSAAEAKQLADANRQRASAGADVVTQTVNAMGEINQSSTKIADIIGTIDGIAFQTNLLALNAAVEAARAGEQGRGFAVVASEVRSLAQRSAEAAKEIKALIEDSVGKVKVGTDLVDKSGKTLQEIIAGTQKVADIIAEIAAASQEQASGIDQVNNAIAQMDNMTQENAALVEESAAASRSMQDQALTLDQLVSFFQIDGQVRLGSDMPTTRLGNGNGKGNGHAQPAKPAQTVDGNRTHLEHLKQAKAKPKADESSEWEQF